jgi:hypothetical protein
MLLFVVMASLSGVKCEAQCAHPNAVHSCCPSFHESGHSNPSIASVGICTHQASVLSSDPVAPYGFIAVFAASPTPEPAEERAGYASLPAQVTVSPPRFNLRI